VQVHAHAPELACLFNPQQINNFKLKLQQQQANDDTNNLTNKHADADH